MPAALAIDLAAARRWLAACDLHRSLRRVEVARGPLLPDPGWESHPVPTLVACLEGVVRIERPGGAVDCLAGEALLLAPGAAHRHAPLRRGSCQLQQGFMLGLSDLELGEAERTWRLAIPEHPACDLLARACGAPARDRLALVREALAGLGGASAQAVAPMPAAVERMWLFLRRARLSPIHAREVLAASGLGATRAHLLFTAYFGETPHRMLTRHRLEFARQGLAAGRPVAAVAAACGFRSRRHLTAAFRAAQGASPRRWRQGLSRPAAPAPAAPPARPAPRCPRPGSARRRG